MTLRIAGKVVKIPKDTHGEILRCRGCGSNCFREVIVGPVYKDDRLIHGSRELLCDKCGKSAVFGYE